MPVNFVVFHLNTRFGNINIKPNVWLNKNCTVLIMLECLNHILIKHNTNSNIIL